MTVTLEEPSTREVARLIKAFMKTKPSFRQKCEYAASLRDMGVLAEELNEIFGWDNTQRTRECISRGRNYDAFIAYNRELQRRRRPPAFDPKEVVWNHEGATEYLINHWDSMSASQICAALLRLYPKVKRKVTRNAVIGKANRLRGEGKLK